jgi:signal transduction histidine kinase
VTLLVIGAFLAGAVVAVAVVRVSTQRESRELQQDLQETRRDLALRERSSREDRHVQGLILATMQEGVLLLDHDGEVVFANDAIERHLGSRPGRAGEMFPIALRDLAAGVAETGRPETIEMQRDHPSRWLRVRATGTGDDGAVLLVVTDVTEARRLDAVRRDFVANASHELKTPAASIRAVAETLNSIADTDPEATRRFATQLERESVRLSQIVADLLDLSRLESGGAVHGPLRLDVLAREETAALAPEADEADVTITITAAEPVAVSGSKRDLSLLVRNLLDNALRASSAGARIDVSVAFDGDPPRAVIVVRDEGAGIPARDLPRIFERFFRIDRARSRGTGGTGLGLAIVKHVAESHRGKVDVESTLGEGSTFTVSLPPDPGAD